MRERLVVGTVLAATVALAGGSAHQLATRLVGEAPLDAMDGVSARWAPVEFGTRDWIASEGIAPPPGGATRDDLLAWLDRHYPVLAAEAREQKRRPPGGPGLELGGGPPRDLAVEPGVGLVLREP